jgi:hypothetical protein
MNRESSDVYVSVICEKRLKIRSMSKDDSKGEKKVAARRKP